MKTISPFASFVYFVVPTALSRIISIIGIAWVLWISQSSILKAQNYFPFEIQSVSTAPPELRSQSANGSSLAPCVSANGQWIAFVSQADNLVTNGLFPSLTGSPLNLYVYGVSNRTVQLVSANFQGSAGGNNHSTSPTISADGRWIAFASEASDLVTNDFNGASDVFVRDQLTGQTRLVSVNLQGTASGNKASYSPAISADGRYVAFLSAASDLVESDTNKLVDVFVRDLERGTTSWVTRGARVSSGNLMVGDPVISADGSTVAFMSTATNWVSWSDNDPSTYYRSVIAAYDIPSGKVVRASAGLTSTLATTGVSNITVFPYNPALSADGTIVAFKCIVTQPPAPSTYAAIFYFDRATGTTQLVTTNATDYSPVGADGGGPVMDDSGRWLVYLEKGATPDTQIVFRFDRVTGEKTVVSRDLAGAGAASGLFLSPVISADGKTIVYAGQSNQLPPSGSVGAIQVYAYDCLTQSNRLISATAAGQPGAVADTADISLSQDGTVIAFCGLDGPMIPGDRNHASDVFAMVSKESYVRLVSAAVAGSESLTANGPSLFGRDSMSEDGRYVVITSAADNLVANDSNRANDVFVRDMDTGALMLVSANTNNAPANSWSGDPVISKDGRFVAFVSPADDLLPGYANNGNPAVFVRDLVSKTTLLASANWTNRNANGLGASAFPAISADGRWIAFVSDARDICLTPASFVGGLIYLFDRIELTNRLVNVDGNGKYYYGTMVQPRLSEDGRFVLFNSISNSTTMLLAYDRQAGVAQIVNTNCNNAQGLERFWQASLIDGWVAYSRYSPNANTNIYLYDLMNKTNYPTTIAGDMPVISPDGRWLLSVTPVAAANSVTNWQLGLYDRVRGGQTLLSVSSDGRNVLGTDRAESALSPDAAWAVFRSPQPGLAPGETIGLRRVFVRDIAAGVNFEVTEGVDNRMRSRWPCSDYWLSPNGEYLLVATSASDLSRGDRNGLTDIYRIRLQTGFNTATGLLDNWCYRYFGRLDVSATADPDGDGLDNLAEFFAGTDPLSAASSLVIAVPSLTTNGFTTLRWPAVVNKNYHVEYRDDLSGSDWRELLAEISISGLTARIIDPTPPTVRRFYRVRVEP